MLQNTRRDNSINIPIFLTDWGLLDWMRDPNVWNGVSTGSLLHFTSSKAFRKLLSATTMNVVTSPCNAVNAVFDANLFTLSVVHYLRAEANFWLAWEATLRRALPSYDKLWNIHVSARSGNWRETNVEADLKQVLSPRLTNRLSIWRITQRWAGM